MSTESREPFENNVIKPQRAISRRLWCEYTMSIPERVKHLRVKGLPQTNICSVFAAK